MTARQLMEQLQQYALNRPDCMDQPVTLTIYRGGKTRFNLTTILSGIGWSALRPGESEHITLSIRKQDLKRT